MAKTRLRDNVAFEAFSSYIAECGLEGDMRAVCLKHRVTLRDIFLDARGPTVHAARMEIWRNLTSFGKSSNEVGTIFFRDATSVQHAMKRMNERACEMGVPLDADHVHDVARSVAGGTLKSWQQSGANVAALTNAKYKP